MSDDNTELQSWTDPEIEARVVAWVLGEASDFEAAELERLVAEEPELGIFKKRIESVHGLVGAAVKPEEDVARMSETRREKLLEKLGGGKGEAAAAVVAIPIANESKAGRGDGWKGALGIAACAAVAAMLVWAALPSYHGEMVPSKTGSAGSVQILLRTPESPNPERLLGIMPPAMAQSARQQVQQMQVAVAALPAGDSHLFASAGPVAAPEDLGSGMNVAQKRAGKGGDASGVGADRMFVYKAKPRLADRDDAELAATRSPQAGVPEQNEMGFDAPRNGGGPAKSPSVEAKFAAIQQQNEKELSMKALFGQLKFKENERDTVTKESPMVATGSMASEARASSLAQAGGATLSIRGDDTYTGGVTVTNGSLSLPSTPTSAYTGTTIVSGGDISLQRALQRDRAPDAAGGAPAAAAAPAADTFALSTASGPALPAADEAPVAASSDGLGGGAGGADASGGGATQTLERAKDIRQSFDDAKGYRDTGRYDQAYKQYDKILNKDPYNIAARKGQEEVSQLRDQYSTQAYDETRAQLSWQLNNGWQMPVHKFGIKGTENFSASTVDVRHDEYITDKLNRIIIPKIEFRNATVREAIDFLKQKSRELDTQEPDPTRRGVNMLVNDGSDNPQTQAAAAAPSIPGLDASPASTANAPAVNAGDARITLSLNNIPLNEALKYIASLTNLKLKVDPYAVSLVRPSVSTEELVTKEYKVPPGFTFGTATPPRGGDASGAGASIAAPQSAMEFLTKQGISFPQGSNAVYFPGSNRLIVHNTEANMELVDATLNKPDAITRAKVDDHTKKTEGKESQQAVLTDDETKAADEVFSTFSLHVSDVSFLLAREALAKGQMPDREQIRPEEFYNAFDYGDPSPGTGEQVACKIEQAAHPVLQQRNIVRVAMKVAATGRGAGQPLRLTVLLDTSGSMERPDRAASVKRAMEVLTSLLGKDDSVSLIGFARQPRLLAESVAGDQAGKLVEMVKNTPPDGGTNMEEAIKLAGEIAQRHEEAGAQNRVVLLTDGAANLGDAKPEQLGTMVEALRQKGIAFDACGVGADGLNDAILEALTRKGGGRYYLLDTPENADEGFARQVAGAFRPAAENVKVQVRFNPARVGKYKLIGFEKHRLNTEDFRNDKVAAAQLAAEEAGVALYQVEALPEGEGEIGEVFVRFRDQSTGRMVEQSWTIPYDAQTPTLDKASPTMQLATTAALLAEKLRGGPMADALDLDALAPVVAQLRSHFALQPRVRDLVTMYEQIRRVGAH